jgi:hypothetical protein
LCVIAIVYACVFRSVQVSSSTMRYVLKCVCFFGRHVIALQLRPLERALDTLNVVPLVRALCARTRRLTTHRRQTSGLQQGALVRSASLSNSAFDTHSATSSSPSTLGTTAPNTGGTAHASDSTYAEYAAGAIASSQAYASSTYYATTPVYTPSHAAYAASGVVNAAYRSSEPTTHARQQQQPARGRVPQRSPPRRSGLSRSCVVLGDASAQALMRPIAINAAVRRGKRRSSRVGRPHDKLAHTRAISATRVTACRTRSRSSSNNSNSSRRRRTTSDVVGRAIAQARATHVVISSQSTHVSNLPTRQVVPTIATSRRPTGTTPTSNNRRLVMLGAARSSMLRHSSSSRSQRAAHRQACLLIRRQCRAQHSQTVSSATRHGALTIANIVMTGVTTRSNSGSDVQQCLRATTDAVVRTTCERVRRHIAISASRRGVARSSRIRPHCRTTIAIVARRRLTVRHHHISSSSRRNSNHETRTTIASTLSTQSGSHSARARRRCRQVHSHNISSTTHIMTRTHHVAAINRRHCSRRRGRHSISHTNNTSTNSDVSNSSNSCPTIVQTTMMCDSSALPTPTTTTSRTTTRVTPRHSTAMTTTTMMSGWLAVTTTMMPACSIAVMPRLDAISSSGNSSCNTMPHQHKLPRQTRRQAPIARTRTTTTTTLRLVTIATTTATTTASSVTKTIPNGVRLCSSWCDHLRVRDACACLFRDLSCVALDGEEDEFGASGDERGDLGDVRQHRAQHGDSSRGVAAADDRDRARRGSDAGDEFARPRRPLDDDRSRRVRPRSRSPLRASAPATAPPARWPRNATSPRRDAYGGGSSSSSVGGGAYAPSAPQTVQRADSPASQVRSCDFCAICHTVYKQGFRRSRRYESPHRRQDADASLGASASVDDRRRPRPDERNDVPASSPTRSPLRALAQQQQQTRSPSPTPSQRARSPRSQPALTRSPARSPTSPVRIEVRLPPRSPSPARPSSASRQHENANLYGDRDSHDDDDGDGSDERDIDEPRPRTVLLPGESEHARVLQQFTCSRA